jgi:hypothetical protein
MSMPAILRAFGPVVQSLFGSRQFVQIERFMAAILAEAAEVGGLHHHYERVAV